MDKPLNMLTSGDCAAAAARAAAVCLLFRINYDFVTINHGGNSRRIPVFKDENSCNDRQACFYAVMEDGVAPNTKDKAEIYVTVSRISDFYNVSENAHIDIRYGNLFMCGGEGIASAAYDTDDVLRGQALIEHGSRKLIFDAVAEACEVSDGAQLLLITVSCPSGMMIAAKLSTGQNTFMGGISIVGDYGTISKIHQRDIILSIEKQIKFQTTAGVKSILISPGDYCADKIRESLHIPLTSAVRCYNYPGDAIDIALESGVENLLLVGNAGKLVKLAAGIMNTNSFSSDGRREIFAAHTAIVGGMSSQVRTVMKCDTTDEILALLTSWGIRDKVLGSIMGAIHDNVKNRSRGKMRFGVALFSKEFGLLGQTLDTKNVLTKVSQEQYALSLKLK